jgi:alpha 1,2-mannosyltransferase
MTHLFFRVTLPLVVLLLAVNHYYRRDELHPTHVWERPRTKSFHHQPHLVPPVPRLSTPDVTRENAVMVMLARNSDVYAAKETLAAFERRFNHRYHYPYVFLNDVPFTEEFMEHVQAVTSGECKFGVVPTEHWSYPERIDQEYAKLKRQELQDKGIIYGGSESYRHMCRFFSGFFYRHELLQEYAYYWRLEPDVNYLCDIDFDPFTYMRTNNKVYSFTITMHEYMATIPTLWNTVKRFMKDNADLISSPNSMEFISNDQGESYNSCHYWSNFEIANFSFLRSEAYSKFFEYLDASGGFFYERWGDAPVHSIAASLLLRPDQIHFFDEIGYYHVPYIHCPKDPRFRTKCFCNPDDSIDDKFMSCTKKWVELYGKTLA